MLRRNTRGDMSSSGSSPVWQICRSSIVGAIESLRRENSSSKTGSRGASLGRARFQGPDPRVIDGQSIKF
jgi:hypothetical protein